MTCVADIVREEFCTDILLDDMTLSRLMLYDQSIEESTLKRMARNLKRSRSIVQDQPRPKKRAQTQERSRSAKVKFEREGGSQNEKPTCM